MNELLEELKEIEKEAKVNQIILNSNCATVVGKGKASLRLIKLSCRKEDIEEKIQNMIDSDNKL